MTYRSEWRHGKRQAGDRHDTSLTGGDGGRCHRENNVKPGVREWPMTL